jgi:hypothetical protein
MEEYLAFLDEDKDYILKLVDYIRSNGPKEIQPLVFTEIASLKSFEEKSKILLYVVSKKQFEENEACFSELKNSTVILSDNAALTQEKKAPLHIFKYQSAKEIMRCLLLQVKRSNGSVALSNDKALDTSEYYESDNAGDNSGGDFLDTTDKAVPVVTFYSIAREEGGITFIKKLLRKSRKRKKSLFISFDIFESNLTGEEICGNLSDVLYYCCEARFSKDDFKRLTTYADDAKLDEEELLLKEKGLGLWKKMQLSICSSRGGFDYLCGITSLSDFNELKEDAISKMLLIIKYYSRYDNIIIDAGSAGNHLLQLFEESDDIILVDRSSSRRPSKKTDKMSDGEGDADESPRIRKLKRFMSVRGNEEMLKKIEVRLLDE